MPAANKPVIQRDSETSELSLHNPEYKLRLVRRPCNNEESSPHSFLGDIAREDGRCKVSVALKPECSDDIVLPRRRAWSERDAKVGRQPARATGGDAVDTGGTTDVGRILAVEDGDGTVGLGGVVCGDAAVGGEAACVCGCVDLVPTTGVRGQVEIGHDREIGAVFSC